MTNLAAAKRLFLELSQASWNSNERLQGKRRVLSEVEMELNVAEKLLDNLAKNKNTNMQVLSKLNNKIEELKNSTTSVKQKLRL